MDRFANRNPLKSKDTQFDRNGVFRGALMWFPPHCSGHYRYYLHTASFKTIRSRCYRVASLRTANYANT